jgi:hypothetical protein
VESAPEKKEELKPIAVKDLPFAGAEEAHELLAAEKNPIYVPSVKSEHLPEQPPRNK